jgi:putative transposase
MSYTRLRYHIVTATKHRDVVITPEVEAIIYPALQQKAVELGGKLLSIGGVEDHIHLVASIPPTLAVAMVVQRLKAASSRAVNAAEVLEGLFAWQGSYGRLR